MQQKVGFSIFDAIWMDGVLNPRWYFYLHVFLDQILSAVFLSKILLCVLKAAKKVLKTGNFKSLTRKPSYSSFFSVVCPDLKNVSATSEGAQGIFSKITFLKSGRSNEKDEVCHSFLVEIFTKSLHRGGVSELVNL